MVNFRRRVKGKGKRWKKGHSSSSNPETKKFRDVAKSRFFQENAGEGNLTSEALKKHDSLLGTKRSKSEDFQDDYDDASYGGTFKTFQTFASDWSECSNMSFSRLLKGFRSDSALHKEMLAVLAAVTEVIKSNGGKETTVEYLGALMTTLDVCESEESLTAVLMLLGMGIKKVPASVLKLKYPEMSKSFVDILGKFAETDNAAILRALIGCLSVLLQAQEHTLWSSSSTLQAFDSIITFVTHSKPKIRKAAQHAVCAILKGSHFMRNEDPPEYHPAAAHVAKYLIKEVESGGSLGGSTSTLHTLGLLKEVLSTFPKPQLKAACESILKVMLLGNMLVTSCGMQALHGLFVSRPSASCLPPQLNAQLVTALFEYQPASSDTQPTLAWLAVMQEAYINLGRVELALCFANLPRLFTACIRLWLSDKLEVMNAATSTLKAVTEDCVSLGCAPELVKGYRQTLGKLFSSIEGALTYQYHSAWHHVLHLIAVWFQVAGETCRDLMMSCLKMLAELRDSYRFSYVNELEFAVGRAIRSLGPETVLTAMPLQITGEETSYEFKRSWLLPLLRENVNSSKLQFFLSYFLPMAVTCRNRSTALLAEDEKIGAHSYELLQSQIWALLPCFCNNPTDLKEKFKVIAKILGTTISEHKDLRLTGMTALRKLITSSQEANNEENVNEMARFAKNYLPILFNFYTTKPNGTDEEGQRLAAYETIKIYLQIANHELCHEMFDRALDKLNAEEVDDFVKESVLDLLRALLCYQDEERLARLYTCCEDRLVNVKNHHEQKKAYRLLEELCGSSAEVCKNYVKSNLEEIQKLLLESLSTAAAPSKGPRLRCLSSLVAIMDYFQLDVLKEIVPEAVLCCKDINERCRTAAYNLLVQICEVMQKFDPSEDTFRDYMGLLMAGLAGTPTLMSASILAITRTTHEFRDSLPLDLVKLILENVCLLVDTNTREIVSSGLSFLKMFLTSFPYDTVAQFVTLIVTTLVQMVEDCKHHFRLKTRNLFDRLIRKFGYDAIVSMVPKSDVITHKRLRNLHKIQVRKKKSVQDEEDNDSDQEKSFTVKSRPKSIEEILADSEESDIETEVTSKDKPKNKNKKKKKASSTWIQEDGDNIVDFTDVSAAKKITATHPTAQKNVVVRKEKCAPFKTATDGRLIIKDDSDSGDEGDAAQRKPANSDLESGDEDDNKSFKALVGRKRKLSVSEAVTGVGQPSTKYQAGGSGIHRPVKRSAGRSRTTSLVSGAEYQSKKAKGDVKKKGRPDPYAYVPLSRKVLNRRKKKKYAGQFASYCHAAQKGVRKGVKSKKKEAKK
ncbi:RRP12-like protein [Periplaneta americana]|uniref:RRP12-like protein n=1 Tax=Periplaneta americana TaxID=6978 RepID=UPI0037E78F36